jgi:hypothetical protein
MSLARDERRGAGEEKVRGEHPTLNIQHPTSNEEGYMGNVTSDLVRSGLLKN